MPAPHWRRTCDSGRSWSIRWPTRSRPSIVDLLDRFLRDPVKVFLRERLGVSLWDRTREYEDAIPIDPDALAKWGIAERILRARLDGASWDECEKAETARGALPPASLADPVLDEMEQDIEELVLAGQHLSDLPPTSLDVHVDLPGLPSVVGAVAGVRGNVIPMVTYRRMQPALRMSAWVRLLALSATYPELPFETQTIGRTPKGARHAVAMATVGPLDPDPQTRRDVARAHLAVLVELFGRGMREPLPLFCKTSAAYAADRALGREPGEAAQSARKEWESRNDWDNENRDKEQRFVLGEELTFADMVTLTGSAAPGEGADARPSRAPSVRRLRPYALGRASGVREPEAPVKPSVALGQADDQVPSFDVCGPLPRGTTLLEASAGTGKTFTIAALTARYVAEEGLPIERLLVITFTRMATGELRERVRERLVRAFDGLVDVLAGNEPSEDDDILQILAAVPRAEQEQRRNRLAKAIAEFDAATIETTHGFCLQVLYGLGTAGDVDRDVDACRGCTRHGGRGRRRPLPPEVRPSGQHDRVFAGGCGQGRSQGSRHPGRPPGAPAVRWGRPGIDAPPVRRARARRRWRRANAPSRSSRTTTSSSVCATPSAIRHEVRWRGARLRERYDVVLVDEFQDTDPVQWDIMRTAFDAEGKTLVLIGDPKQAIYAFRGADVHTYLKAKATVQSKWTLDVNWRSDEGLLAAYDALFQGAQLGQVGITYRNVRAAPPNTEPRLLRCPGVNSDARESRPYGGRPPAHLPAEGEGARGA